MKEIYEKLPRLLPEYSKQTLELLVGPKRFIAAQDLASPDATHKGLTYLSVSVVLAFIAQIPLLPDKQDHLAVLLGLAFVSAFGIALTIVMVIASWKLVGARIEPRKFITSTFYLSGLSTVMFVGVALLANGTLSALDHEHYAKIRDGYVFQADEFTPGIWLFNGIMAAGFTGIYLWLYCIWGTYREITGVSRLRSGIAFAIFSLLSPIVLLIPMLMGLGTGMPQIHFESALPAELVGVWQVEKNPDIDDHALRNVVTYTFATNPSSFMPSNTLMVGVQRVTFDGKCNQVLSQIVSSIVKVRDAELTLHPVYRSDNRGDSCSGHMTLTESKVKGDAEVYRYELRHQTTGTELCINGRYGEVCMKPVQP